MCTPPHSTHSDLTIVRFQSQDFFNEYFKNCKKCDFPVGEGDVVDLQKKKKVRGGKKNIVHEGKKGTKNTLLSTLKVMSTLEVFWLASLLITGDIYFDNYSVERFLKVNIFRLLYLSELLSLYELSYCLSLSQPSLLAIEVYLPTT